MTQVPSLKLRQSTGSLDFENIKERRKAYKPNYQGAWRKNTLDFNRTSCFD